jgi:ElaB/YqjD/DUF883 family membrane-anchored ribosome-binding protein
MSDLLEARRMQLIHDLRTVIRDTQALVRASVEDGKSDADGLKQSIAADLGRAMERLQRLEADAETAIKHSAQHAQIYIKDHPVQAMGVAAALGLLIGLWARRR